MHSNLRISYKFVQLGDPCVPFRKYYYIICTQEEQDTMMLT